MQAEQERGEERYDKEGKRGRGGIALEQVLESRKSVASANLEINRGKSVERDGSNEKWSKLISFGSRPKDETPEVSRHGEAFLYSTGRTAGSVYRPCSRNLITMINISRWILNH